VCNEYNYCYEYILAAGTAMQQQAVFVQYEQLVAGAQTQKIADFTGVHNLNLDKLWERRVNSWTRQTYEEWVSPLNGKQVTEKSVGKFDAVLSDAQISYVSERCQSTYEQLIKLST